MEEINERIFAKDVPHFLTVNIGLTLFGPTVCSNDNNLAVGSRYLISRNPVINLSRLRAFPRLPHYEIHGRRAEEQLMSRAINSLTAEVPTVEGDFFFAFAIRYFDLLDFDSVRCGQSLNKCFTTQGAQ